MDKFIKGTHTHGASLNHARLTPPASALGTASTFPIALGHAHLRIGAAMADARLRLPVTLCHVDHANGCVAVGVDDASPSLRRALDVLADGVPLRVFRCAPGVRHANKKDHNRPLKGGLYVNCPSVSGEGTLCIVAARGGERGFVTCGHVVERKDVKVYQPRKSDINDWLIGEAKAVSDYEHEAISDSAFVACPESVSISARTIWKSSSTHFTVDGTDSAPALGMNVSMQGASTATTLRTGDICATNVTVTFVDGGVLTGQLLANYVSSEGDSGAPVFKILDGLSVSLVGLNVGATQPDHVDPKPDPLLWPPAGDGTYAIISPWANVEQDLNVKLDLP